MVTMGSLFSGFGGFEIAAGWYGVKVLWQSEIEPWAVELLKTNFPEVKQLGSVTDINGAKIEPVDIITFGSPCQDMSVAGGRKGMKHICTECGAEIDISDKIEKCPDCGAPVKKTRSGLFMEAIRIIREMREATNGEYPKYAIWENVPGAFTSNKGHDFRAVLEEITEAEIPMPASGRWATAGMVRGGKCDVSWRTLDAQYWGTPQRRKRIYLVADYRAERSAEILFKPESVSRYPAPSGEPWEEITSSIGESIDEAGGAATDCGIVLNDQGGDSITVEKGNASPTLRAQTHGHPPIILYRISSYHSNGMKSNNPEVGFKETDKCCTLDTDCGEPSRQQGGMATVNTLTSTDYKGVQLAAIPVAVFQGQASSHVGISYSEKVSPTIQCKKQADILMLLPAYGTYIVRRLTPTECAKLQGFPEDWHKGVVNGKNKPIPDSAAYKGYGNAVATVCAEYPIQGIVGILETE